jgi:hypothetical protein
MVLRRKWFCQTKLQVLHLPLNFAAAGHSLPGHTVSHASGLLHQKSCERPAAFYATPERLIAPPRNIHCRINHCNEHTVRIEAPAATPRSCVRSPT